MAFTNAELTKIRAVLGYPNAYRYKNPRLESALVQADSDGEAYIRSELAAIVEIDAAMMSGGMAFDAAGVKKVDEIEFQTGSNQTVLSQLQRAGRVHIARISDFFGTPINADYYGQNGYPGDPWSDQMTMRNSPLGVEVKLG